MTDFASSLFRCRDYGAVIAAEAKAANDASEGTVKLKRVLGAHDLVLFGLGNIVGGGIYILFGVAVHAAGPAVTISFLATGLAATCSALCYGEFAARIPTAGSAYVFTYLEVGEFLAWHVGWAMVLEMVTGGAAVAVGWSNYTRSFISGMGIDVHWLLMEVPLGQYFKLDLMALCFLLFITCVVAMGISESKTLNHVAACVKVGALGFVVVFAFMYANAENWVDFSPMGNTGIVRAAATVMFAYTGFEIVAQCAEETKDPKWALPVGIVGSVLISSLIYALVAASVTLMVPWKEIDLSAPLALAFAKRQPWLVSTISAAAVVGLFAIGLGNVLASSRLLMTLGRDGLLPRGLGVVNETSKTPVVATLLVGALAASQTLMFSYQFLTEMVSVGTMFAFTMVCIDLIFTRSRDPDRPGLLPSLLIIFVGACFATCMAWHRSLWLAASVSGVLAVCFGLYICTLSRSPPWAADQFIVPMGAAVGLLGVAMNVIMTVTLKAALEWNLAWFAIGWVIYFGFGRHHSKLSQHEGGPLSEAL